MDSLSPNLANAVAGQYKLSIKDMFREAWQKVSGIKLSFWGAFLYLFLTILGLDIAVALIASLGTLLNLPLFAKILNVVGSLLVSITSTLLWVSLIYLMIQHVMGRPIRAKMIFNFQGTAKPLTIIAVIMILVYFLLITIGILSFGAVVAYL